MQTKGALDFVVLRLISENALSPSEFIVKGADLLVVGSFVSEVAAVRLSVLARGVSPFSLLEIVSS